MFNIDNLDKYQREAVITDKRNVLVVAAPGSGKTTTIVNRVRYLVEEKKVNPINIIVITFTKAAAINMKERYVGLAKTNSVPFFGTFHSLFYKILKRYKKNFDIIQSRESFNLLKSALLNYFDEISEEKIKEIQNTISLFKTSNLTLEEFKPEIDKNIFIHCYNEYEKYKKEKNLLDFDDLQLNCKEIFEKEQHILEGYRDLFKYILVDEFQDCDLLQVEILKKLNKQNSLFAVGDEDQCIYGFRGSRPDCMVEFHKYFKDSHKVFLLNNYRSPKNLINNSVKLIQNNKMRNNKPITPYKSIEKPILIRNYLDESMQTEDITENILKLVYSESYSYKDNAILYRTNLESRSLIDGFIRKKVPFKLLDKNYNFFEHFICKDIIAYLNLSIDTSNREAFARIINKPFRYISRQHLERVKYYEKKMDCFEILKTFEDFHPFQMKNMDKLKKEINFLNKSSFLSAIDYIIYDLGYHDYIREYSEKYKQKLSELEDIINEFRESAKEYNSILTFLDHVKEVGEEIEKGKNNFDVNKDAVILSTIHGVKGMEYKNIFIINCDEEYIPHVNSINTIMGIEEERRLFYVAVTRTMENLFISFTQSIKGKPKEPSRFIKELGFDCDKSCEHLFNPGSNIYHKAFGEGKVLSIDHNNIEIEFKKGIVRKFDLTLSVQNGLIRKVGSFS